MNKIGKIWGFTSEIFNKNNVEIHRIVINKDTRCSKHKHEHKYNIFFVESGRILIKEWKNEYSLIDETDLSAGEMCSIKPGSYHEFHGLEDSIVYEIYYVELSNEDIVRENTGSKLINE
jgi:mannose-6-phosphate isomerase-like protein (cupin superfamily)